MLSASESQLTSNSAVITKEREGTRKKKERKGMEWAIIGSREGKERERDSVGMGEREREKGKGGEREEADPSAVIVSLHHNGREKNGGK